MDSIATSGPVELGEGAPAPGGIAKPATETVRLQVGEHAIGFRVANVPGARPLFSLGVRKSGSTMLHKIVQFLANRNGANIVDVPGTFFKAGFTVSHWANLDLSPMIRPGNVYTGFRSYPAEMARSDAFRDAPKIFMFRDPRDALVSQYFSDAYSHEIPKETGTEGREIFLKKRDEALHADIDEWVLDKAGGIRRTLEQYEPLLSDPTCLPLRYENYVFQKRRLVAKILHQFGWTIQPAQLNRLLADIDVVPDSEDKARFVRRVIPGDHIAKLKDETVRRLNNKLSGVLRSYDYH